MTNALNLVAPVDTLAMEFTREFDAPVEALFRAHAEPELMKQWLGPHDLEMQITEWDFKSHGGYRYPHSNERGTYGFNGTFHTVRPDEFILQTFEFEGAPDSVNIEYMWFDDLGNGARLRGRSICPKRGARRAADARHGRRHDRRLRKARRAPEEPVDGLDAGSAVPLPAFYRDQLGFALDHHTQAPGMNFAQLTPPGSGCSIVIGNLPGGPAMPPGSLKGLQLVVADAYLAREELRTRGVEVGEIEADNPLLAP